MRANDIELLREHHVPPRLIRVLREMYEEHEALKQQMLTLAGMFDRMCNLTIGSMGAMEALRAKLPHLQALKQQGMEVGSDPSLTGEIGEDDGR